MFFMSPSYLAHAEFSFDSANKAQKHVTMLSHACKMIEIIRNGKGKIEGGAMPHS